MKKKIKKMLRIGLHSWLIVLVALAMSGLALVKTAKADALTSKSDIMSRLEASVAANHTIEFTLSATGGGVAAGEDITITFPAGFDTSTIVVADIDFEDNGTNLELLGTCSGTTWGAAMASDILTLTSCTGTIAASHTVTIEIGTHATFNAVTGTHQITNDTAGTKTIAIAGSNGDDGNLLVQIIADDSVNVTATVGETLSFVINDTEIGFGSLSASTGRWATADANGTDASPALPDVAHTLEVGTNASGGWAVTYNGALLTSGASDTIDGTTGITGDGDGNPAGASEEFGISASTNGNAGIATGYERTATPNWDWETSTTTTLVSEIVPTATETISVSYLANIVALTEAGDYETDITYIATATF
ncbi:MAG: hypothetical protein U9M90_00650 [Patescibacteria group bacterium]|nr:hypothetical protein [Patescibacteria group bacterium]